MLKVLIVYYSLTGNTRLIAETIQKSVNADAIELKPIKELNAESSSKYFWGGAQAIMKKKPKLELFELNPLDYDLIFMGSPVWAWRYTPPIRSFLSKFDLSGKNVALWMCCDGDGTKSTERFKDALKDANIIDEIWFQKTLQSEEESKEKAISWANRVIEKINTN